MEDIVRSRGRSLTIAAQSRGNHDRAFLHRITPLPSSTSDNDRDCLHGKEILESSHSSRLRSLRLPFRGGHGTERETKSSRVFACGRTVRIGAYSGDVNLTPKTRFHEIFSRSSLFFSVCDLDHKSETSSSCAGSVPRQR